MPAPSGSKQSPPGGRLGLPSKECTWGGKEAGRFHKRPCKEGEGGAAWSSVKLGGGAGEALSQQDPQGVKPPRGTREFCQGGKLLLLKYISGKCVCVFLMHIFLLVLLRFALFLFPSFFFPFGVYPPALEITK